MKLSRRGLLLASGGTALLPMVGPGFAVLLSGANSGGVGEIWGLAYWSRDAMAVPHVAPARSRTVPPAWHPEFIWDLKQLERGDSLS